MRERGRGYNLMAAWHQKKEGALGGSRGLPGHVPCSGLVRASGAQTKKNKKKTKKRANLI